MEIVGRLSGSTEVWKYRSNRVARFFDNRRRLQMLDKDPIGLPLAMLLIREHPPLIDGLK